MKNHIAIVLDRSGSMHSIRRETIAAFNGMVEEIRSRSAETGQETSVTLVTFSNRARIEFYNADVRTLKPLTESTFRPDGATALFDGFGQAVKTLEGLPDANHQDTSFLVLVVTDGEENASAQFTAAEVNRLLRNKQSTDRWSFAFQLPPGHAGRFIADFGISRDNVREWEATSKGVKQAETANREGLTGYFRARASGKRSVESFYVTTDLSKVSVKDVKMLLDDISDRFRLFTVDQEASVREFIEAKTGRPYVIGSAYYLLMKSEKVQPRKAVLIMEKGKKAVWGGAEARDLIGLPGGAEARVTPGNHSSFDIYVQSTSVNRKLPRGTKVLLDVSQVHDLEPTWNHTGATSG